MDRPELIPVTWQMDYDVVVSQWQSRAKGRPAGIEVQSVLVDGLFQMDNLGHCLNRIRRSGYDDVHIAVQLLFHGESMADADHVTVTIRSLLEMAPGANIKWINLGRKVGHEPSAAKPRSDGMSSLTSLLRRIRLDVEASGAQLFLEIGLIEGLRSPFGMRSLLDAANGWAYGACIDLDGDGVEPDGAVWLTSLLRHVRFLRGGASSLRPLASVLEEIRYAGPVVLT